MSAQKNQITVIEVLGAKKTKIGFVNKLLISKVNQPLDSLQLNTDISTLKRLPGISNAHYKVQHISFNDYKVTIHLEENFTLIPIINVWTTTNKRLAYKVGLFEYHFLGSNITLGGFYQYNGFDTYAFTIKYPNLFSRKIGLEINYQNWKSEEPLYFQNSSANYLYNNVSLEMLGLYEVNFNHQLQLGLSLFNEKYSFLSGEIPASIPAALDLNKRLLKLVYQYDNLNYHFQYVEGFKSVFYGQYVQSSSRYQSDFLIAWNDFLYYKRVNKTDNWANRLRVGLSSNEASPFAPFALDNQVNLRGVGVLVDRGTGSVVLNSEYRHTFYDTKWLAIQSIGFVDVGSWRNPGGALSDFIASKNIKIYSGIGVRLIPKKIHNAIFRIDYGFKLLNKVNSSNGGLVFGIGHYF